MRACVCVCVCVCVRACVCVVNIHIYCLLGDMFMVDYNISGSVFQIKSLLLLLFTAQLSPEWY